MDGPSQPRLSLFLLQPVPLREEPALPPPQCPGRAGSPLPLHREASPLGSQSSASPDLLPSPRALLGVPSGFPLGPSPALSPVGIQGSQHPSPPPLAGPAAPSGNVGPSSPLSSGEAGSAWRPAQRRARSPMSVREPAQGCAQGSMDGRTDGRSLSPAGGACCSPPASLLSTPGLADRAGRVASSSEPRDRVPRPPTPALPTPGARTLQGAGPEQEEAEADEYALLEFN